MVALQKTISTNYEFWLKYLSLSGKEQAEIYLKLIRSLDECRDENEYNENYARLIEMYVNHIGTRKRTDYELNYVLTKLKWCWERGKSFMDLEFSECICHTFNNKGQCIGFSFGKWKVGRDGFPELSAGHHRCQDKSIRNNKDGHYCKVNETDKDWSGFKVKSLSVGDVIRNCEFNYAITDAVDSDEDRKKIAGRQAVMA